MTTTLRTPHQPTILTFWSPTPSTFCEKWWPSANGPCCCFRVVKTQPYCFIWPPRPLPLSNSPFPCCTSTRARTSPKCWPFATAPWSAIGARLIVAKVQDSINEGKVADPGHLGSRNRLQTVTLLDAITENKFDAAFGGARRDEDKARAKERILSFRDTFGQWDPRQQRPELWQLYQGKVNLGEHVRAFPLSDWTELDVWQYIGREKMDLPSIYFAHERDVVLRDGMWFGGG